MPYPDDCKNRGKEKIVCKVFDMSCAMFHTRMSGTTYARQNKNVCPFYELQVNHDQMR